VVKPFRLWHGHRPNLHTPSLVEPPVSEKLKVYTYIPLVSANRKLLVQVFLDPETNLIVQAQVATRYETWSAWGLPTEVFED
jgi:hypothetical protein